MEYEYECKMSPAKYSHVDDSTILCMWCGDDHKMSPAEYSHLPRAVPSSPSQLGTILLHFFVHTIFLGAWNRSSSSENPHDNHNPP